MMLMTSMLFQPGLEVAINVLSEETRRSPEMIKVYLPLTCGQILGSMGGGGGGEEEGEE